ncbi:DUF2075 domain-containing protein [Nonomuraea zeae]|uniref:DUF2075 domain-containing protein n=1 Tax=Nonomuraea zeae TaxID=1642303 RepID=A0A5S4H355_9ACTN|nr:DUF2075 domain-containing protein [Nonomuraea zeae]TMR39567.1 DUF2075 domain-containing protein [Nonomuraea zeae]
MALQCLYQNSASELAAALADGGFPGELARRFEEVLWQEPGAPEVRSWAGSIPTVVQLLLEAGLGDVQVLLELKAPITDVRMDMVLVGAHPKDERRMSIVVVENKQWSWVQPDGDMVRISRDGKPQLHPATQVWGYRQVLTSYVPLLRDATISGIVNLHNAEGRYVETIKPRAQGLGDEIAGWVTLFGGDQRDAFKETLLRLLSPKKAAEHAQFLLEAPVTSTEGLMTRVADAAHGRQVFPLLDEQREAYDYVRRLVATSRRGTRKEVVLIVGGPGTGKSVIAVELLGAFNRQGVRAFHATGSRSFTQTLWRYAGLAGDERGGFTYFNTFADATPNDIDVLIADEAHRVRETSRNRRGDDDLREPPLQVDELIDAAQVPVFLLDEHQIVRRGEVGSVEMIRDAAERLGCDVHQINLRHQFRCGGSPAYVDWVGRLFGLRPGQDLPVWRPVEGYELYVAPTPAAMEVFLNEQMRNKHKARIAAGFCWPWNPPKDDGALPLDVEIEEWRRPWNLQAKKHLGRIPPWPLWATDPGGYGQIGCVYSAQGFEYDYAGVIVGPDLVWRTDRWVAERVRNQDDDQRGARNFDMVARNTYRVLATRGMRGTVLYAVDRPTNLWLASLKIPLLGLDGVPMTSP